MGGALCCAGELWCGCVCGVCMRCCGTNEKQHARIGYIFIYICCIFWSWIFLYYGHSILAPFTEFGLSDWTGSDEDVCIGVYTIYRLSFALLIFFLLMLWCSLFTGAFSKAVNHGCWITKIFFIVALFILFHFIPNPFFEGYMWFARVASAIFLVIQIIIFIDFAYAWNSAWLENYEQSG